MCLGCEALLPNPCADRTYGKSRLLQASRYAISLLLVPGEPLRQGARLLTSAVPIRDQPDLLAARNSAMRRRHPALRQTRPVEHRGEADPRSRPLLRQIRVERHRTSATANELSVSLRLIRNFRTRLGLATCMYRSSTPAASVIPRSVPSQSPQPSCSRYSIQPPSRARTGASETSASTTTCLPAFKAVLTSVCNQAELIERDETSTNTASQRCRAASIASNRLQPSWRSPSASHERTPQHARLRRTRAAKW